MFNKENLIDDIVSEAFGFDNTPSTCDMERDIRRELHYLNQKPRIGATARRIRHLEQQLKKYEGSTNPNTPVRPSWLGDDDIDKETHFGTETVHRWAKEFPHDEEMVRKSRELREYEKMKELHDNRFNFDEDGDPKDEWFQEIKRRVRNRQNNGLSADEDEE